MTTPRKDGNVPARFLLLLRDIDANDPDAGPVIIRLRRALKTLLRSYGLRCDRAEILAAPLPSGPLHNALGKGDQVNVDQKGGQP
jgi:hypothetical protein